MCRAVVDADDSSLLADDLRATQALEIVHSGAAGMVSGMTAAQLAALEIAYPTYTAVLGLAVRCVSAKLGSDLTGAQWRTLGRKPALVAEWERRDTQA
ncbi:MAG: hypothetical protein R6W76_17220 [Caldilinea sp.]